jgi:hypothetical protein
LQESGVAAPSTTRIGGALAIRAAIVNHRSTHADAQRLFDAVLAIGAQLTGAAPALGMDDAAVADVDGASTMAAPPGGHAIGTAHGDVRAADDAIPAVAALAARES